ncbi:winged helix-turn-helix transcriptional regulator [Brevibacillus daliensis]|uniref:winged helix-turn-helix transcriptional regulator n=1 Tax=Brevibacillus daliensis TaxID=2892995 RepID=UPI001E2F4FE0|nr:helix-turn-helix domain-containing protein [Brevibacillus daliensis]
MKTSYSCDQFTHVCKDFHNTIEFIGKRWMGIIIYSLMSGPKRFYELAESIPGISDRLLTERLQELVEEGLVTKSYLEASIKKVEYQLTPSGEALHDVVVSIKNWIEIRESLNSKIPAE